MRIAFAYSTDIYRCSVSRIGLKLRSLTPRKQNAKQTSSQHVHTLVNHSVRMQRKSNKIFPHSVSSLQKLFTLRELHFINDRNFATLDYCIPQLYWEIGHKLADYATLVDWWDAHAGTAHFYIGQDVARTAKAGDLTRKMSLSRTARHARGNCFWPANELLRNTGGIADSLRERYHRYPALIPAYTNLHKGRPRRICDLKQERTSRGVTLKWMTRGGRSSSTVSPAASASASTIPQKSWAPPATRSATCPPRPASSSTSSPPSTATTTNPKPAVSKSKSNNFLYYHMDRSLRSDLFGRLPHFNPIQQRHS